MEPSRDREMVEKWKGREEEKKGIFWIFDIDAL
jgi:hypothetical protein